jgi:hypothetical protein
MGLPDIGKTIIAQQHTFQNARPGPARRLLLDLVRAAGKGSCHGGSRGGKPGKFQAPGKLQCTMVPTFLPEARNFPGNRKAIRTGDRVVRDETHGTGEPAAADAGSDHRGLAAATP